MGELPLHPGLVHLPIGIAFATPLVALAISFAIIRSWLPRGAWVLVVGLAALQLGTAMVARQSGEEEEERVEKSVPKEAIHEHELAANFFVGSTGLMGLLAAAALLLRKEKPFRAATMALALLFFWPLTVGLRTGHLGGKLVYVHGVPTVGQAPVGTEGGGHHDDDHD